MSKRPHNEISISAKEDSIQFSSLSNEHQRENENEHEHKNESNIGRQHRMIKKMPLITMHACLDAAHSTEYATDAHANANANTSKLEPNGNPKIDADVSAPQEDSRKLEYASTASTRLWHVPDVPPKATTIDFVAYCASMKLKQQQHESKSVSSSENNVADYGDDDDDDNIHFSREGSKSTSNNLGNQEDEDALGNAKDQDATKRNIFHGKLDESAAVAISLLAEESLVSALLPLAKRHVERVRCLESQHSSNRNGKGNRKRNALDPESKPNESLATDGAELILPPDEAITRLALCQKMVTRPPAAAKSTASSSCNSYIPSSESPFLRTISASPSTFNEQTMEETRYFKEWCRQHDFPQDFVHQNMDFFRLFTRNSSSTTMKEIAAPTFGAIPENDSNAANIEAASKAILAAIECGRHEEYGDAENNDRCFPVTFIVKPKQNISNLNAT